MSIDGIPLCDAGRCAVILEAIAKRDERISSAAAEVVAAAIEATLTDLGVDHASATVRSTIAAHLARLSGVGNSSGQVA